MGNQNIRKAWRVNKTQSAAGTTDTVSEQVREPVRRVYVEYVAARNNTRAGSTCQVGILTAGQFHPLVNLTLTAQSTWYPSVVMAWLAEGEALAFNFASVVASDDLRVTMNGTQEFSAPGQEAW